MDEDSGASANIPSEIIEQAIELLQTEPKMMVADDELKHLHGSYLCVGQLIQKLTMKDMQKHFGRSRQSIDEVVKRIQSTLTMAMTNINTELV